jgi:hypothetical protein
VLIYKSRDVGYCIKIYSDIPYNVGLRSLQSDIGSYNIRLSPISLITDIGLIVHVWLTVFVRRSNVHHFDRFDADMDQTFHFNADPESAYTSMRYVLCNSDNLKFLVTLTCVLRIRNISKGIRILSLKSELYGFRSFSLPETNHKIYFHVLLTTTVLFSYQRYTTLL